MEGLSFTHRCTAEVDAPWGETIEIPMEFHFDRSEPLVVEMRFLDPDTGDVNPWTVSRELLDTAIDTPCGPGDVQFWHTDTSKTKLTMCLRSSAEGQEDGYVTVAMSEVRTFLARVDELLPKEAEEEIVQGSLDAFLRDLMEEL